MLDGAAAALVLAAVGGIVVLLQGWALARATRSREAQLRRPRYWGR